MEFLKKLKTTSLVYALLGIVLGMLMIFCPDVTKETFAYLFAGLILVVGIIKVANYFLYGVEPFGFVVGVATICLGIIFMACINSILSSNIIGIIFGVILIIKSIFSIQESFDLRRLGAKNWWLDAILSCIVLAFAISVVCSAEADRIMFELLGITLVIDGIMNMVDVFVVSAKVKKTRKSIKDMLKVDDDNIIDI